MHIYAMILFKLILFVLISKSTNFAMIAGVVVAVLCMIAIAVGAIITINKKLHKRKRVSDKATAKTKNKTGNINNGYEV